MQCPLCARRKAKRACPALGRSICPLCCGTKRHTEIACPPDCAYLTSSREHPSAAVLKHEHADVARFIDSVRDLNTRQGELFLRINSALAAYRPSELQSVVDQDVVDAAAALAATFETASRGVIYDHRPASFPAARLATALKAVVVEAGANGGTAFERDAAVVLRRIEAAARGFGSASHKPTAYLELIARLAADR
jgi:hypothetical protein